MTNTAPSTTSSTSASANSAPSRFRWRIVDIIVAAVIAVACGVIFLGWNIASDVITDPLGAVLPGLKSLGYGLWMLAGPLAALIIRKPGAALFAEVVAASVSALLGAQWGPLTIESGIVQGLAAELVFAIFLYRVWTLPVAMLAGAVAGLAAGINELIIYYPGIDALFAVVYVVCYTISGAVLAGLLGWLLTRALARTGALNRFASGRALAERV